MSVISDIALAVVDELNTGGFSQSFTASLTYFPLSDLIDQGVLLVRVAPSGIVITTANRAQDQEDHTIDVAVQKKLGQDLAGQDAEIAPLTTLVEEVARRLNRKKIVAGSRDAYWVSTTHDPWLSVDHMDQFRAFTSIVRFVFRVFR